MRASVNQEPIVHQVRVGGPNLSRHAIELARGHEGLQIAVRGVQHHGRRRLVHLARLDAEQPVFDHVNAAHAVVPGNRRHGGDQLHERHRHAVQRDWHAAVERQLDIRGVRGPLLDAPREPEHIGGRFGPGILQGTSGINRPTGWHPCCTDSTVAATGMPCASAYNLLLARHAPAPCGCEDAQRRVQGSHGQVQPRLAVALPRRSVSDRGGALHRGEFHELLRHQGACERGGQRILPLVQRHRLQRRQNESTREDVAHMEPVRADRPAASASRA